MKRYMNVTDIGERKKKIACAVILTGSAIDVVERPRAKSRKRRDFKQAIIAKFQVFNEERKATAAIHKLKQSASDRPYIAQFTELTFQISMTEQGQEQFRYFQEGVGKPRFKGKWK